MPKRIFFDTVAFRELGKTFDNVSLAPDLKSRIAISPITLFELFSQLTITDADKILRQIQAARNWAEMDNVGLLPWPDDVLFEIWYGKRVQDDKFTKNMERAFNACLAADSAEQLREEATPLKDSMEKMKEQTVNAFDQLIKSARGKPLKDGQFSDAWFRGIAKRAKAEASSREMSEIIEKLSAYHEFEEVKLLTALQNKDYNPAKHANDLLDAEQLIYLCEGPLCFLTCDRGFQKVKKSSQACRIITVRPEDLSLVANVEALFRKATD
jgi:hypothetical protein